MRPSRVIYSKVLKIMREKLSVLSLCSFQGKKVWDGKRQPLKNNIGQNGGVEGYKEHMEPSLTYDRRAVKSQSLPAGRKTIDHSCFFTQLWESRNQICWVSRDRIKSLQTGAASALRSWGNRSSSAAAESEATASGSSSCSSWETKQSSWKLFHVVQSFDLKDQPLLAVPVRGAVSSSVLICFSPKAAVPIVSHTVQNSCLYLA